MRIINSAIARRISPGAFWMLIISFFLAALTGINTRSGQVSPPPNDTTFTAHAAEIPNSDEAIEMIPVPGGAFEMGPFENGETHEVKVDSFWIGKYEVTWNEYNLFRNEALDQLQENYVPADVVSLPSPPYVDMSFGMGTDGFPAVGITHYAAFMFTKWLTVKTGEFYRLPTEAEWEYACRAANSGEYEPVSPTEIDRFAWTRENSDRKYHKPGEKEPNALDIHDMLGNVAEWTFDQYHKDYASMLENEPADNPFFKPEQLYPRSVRGGSWMDAAEAASCLQRRGSDPAWKMRDPQLPKSLWWHTNAPFVGIRVVKPVEQPESVEEMEKYWIEAMQDYQ